MTSFETCQIEDFVAEVTAQIGSLEEAASTQEILSQQVEGYLNRLRAAMCADVEALKVLIDNSGGGGATNFLGLTDTPANYTGDAARVVSVNAGETALEFTVPAAGGGLPDLVNLTEVASGRQVLGNDSFFKLVDTGALANSGSTFTNHGIASPMRIISAMGNAKNPTTNDNRPLPFSIHPAASSGGIAVIIDATRIGIHTAFNYSPWTSSHIILEYIKIA